MSNALLTDSARRVALTAGCAVGALAFLLALGASWLAGRLGFSAYFLYVAGGVFVLAACFIPRQAARFHQAPRFGLANILTLSRLALTCLLAAFMVEVVRGYDPADTAAWVVAAIAAIALVLDGLDGFAARRSGLASAFGARFDMEVDAFMILVLSVVAFALNKAGVWVIASGLLRYVYVLAASVAPALSRPLAPAWRRKAIAVIQGATLAALLAPVVQPPVSTAAAVIALLLLIYSFGADIMAQVRGS